MTPEKQTPEKQPAYDKDGNEILRTPNPECPCCQAGILHANLPAGYLSAYHPLMGTGIDNIGNKLRKRRSQEQQ